MTRTDFKNPANSDIAPCIRASLLANHVTLYQIGEFYQKNEGRLRVPLNFN